MKKVKKITYTLKVQKIYFIQFKKSFLSNLFSSRLANNLKKIKMNKYKVL